MARRKNQQETTMMSPQVLVVLLLLVLEAGACVATTGGDMLPFSFWLSNVPGAGSTDDDVASAGGCAKKNKDAVLCSAQANTVTNFIKPDNSNEGGYKSIGQSIANIPDGNTKRYILILRGGTVYREKLFLSKSKPFVTIRSDDPINPAVIVWNDTAATPGKDGKPLGVDGSSTVTVESDYFIAYGVVFRNDAAAAKGGGEAPALRVMGTKATFYNCTIQGGQGALYDQLGLHYFKSCTVRGTIDFIFGSAKSFYEDCAIVSVNKEITTLPVAPPQLDPADNPIRVAPGEGGFSFKTCSITGEGEGQGQQIFLGRMGSPSIYSYTQIAKEIVPIIYDDKAGNILIPNNKTGNRCATFKCYGPGLEKIWNLKLTYAEATYFLGTHFIDGDKWILSLPPTDGETLLSI